MEAEGGEFSRLFDRHPRRGGGPPQRPSAVAGGESDSPIAVVDLHLERHRFAGCPAVGPGIRWRRCPRPVVAERLLAIREVEPDRGPAIAVREPDARVAQRRALGRHETAAGREDRRSRAAVGTERPCVGLHPLDVHVVRGEARVDPGACRRPVFAVEHAGDEPAGVIGRREVQREPDPGVNGFGTLVAHGLPAVEEEPINGRAVRCQRPTGEPGRPRGVGRHPTGRRGLRLGTARLHRFGVEFDRIRPHG